MRRQSTRRTRIAWRRRSSAALAVVGALLVGNSLHAGRAIKDSAASAAALGVADDAGMAGMAHTAGMAGMAHAAALTAVPHTIRLGTNSGDVPVGLLDTAVVVWSATPAPDNFFGSLTRGPDGGSGSVLMRTQSGSVGDAVRAAIASHLPQGERLAEITDVRLGATVFVVQGRGDTTETEVREITSDWDVATATYAQRRDGVAWSTPGGDFGNVVGSLTLPNQPGVYQTSSNLVGLMDHGANGFALRVTSPIVPDNNTLLNLSEAPDGRRPYLDVTYTTTTDVPAPPGVPYNPALIPTGSPGSGEVLIRNSGFFPAPSDGTGNFRTECAYSHMLPDDPILYPGQPGRAHLHTF